MPYPMIDKETIKLPIDIGKLPPSHLNFFLQHKEQMRIDIWEKGEILYIINNPDLFKEIYRKIYGIENPEGNDVGGFIFTKNTIDRYLNILSSNQPSL